MIKYYFNITLLIITINCSSVNLVREPITNKDQDSISNLNSDKIKIENKRLFVFGYADYNLANYKNMINSATIEMSDSIGGVDILEIRDLEAKNKELKLVNTANVKALELNQKLGTDEGILQSAKSLDADFILQAKLLNVTLSEKYTPEEEKTLSNGKTIYIDESWTLTLTGEIEFKLFDAKTKKIVFQEKKEHKNIKKYKDEPTKTTPSLLLPKIIEYFFEDIKPDIQAFIPFDTFVIGLKGDKKYAMIAAGNENKIKPKRIFELIEGNETIAEIEITQVNQKDSWGEISGDQEKLKIGSKVRIKPQPLSIFYKIFRKFL